MRGTGQVDDSNPHLSLAAECLPLLTPPFHPYRGSRRGGLFSVALSVGLPRLAVSQHRVLCSSDFPHSSV